MMSGVPPVRKRDGFGIAASLVLALSVWPLYGSAARLWWTFDDFFCIRFLQGKTPLGYLVSPELWRQLGMFNPFQLLSYQADLLLFGLRPAAFYAHQLAALAAAAVALFWLLRLWLSPGLAFLTSLLFLVGVPPAAWVQELLVRHYIEGLLFSIASVWFFVKALREGRPALAVPSALLYLAALLCKEIYVPLLGLLLLLPESDLSLRWRRAHAHVAALSAYLAWRYAVLGTFVGGYGWTTRPEELPALLASLPGKLGAGLVGSSAFATGALIAALSAGLAAGLFRQRRAALLFFGTLLLALAPILPVSKSFHPRYGGLAWLAIAVAFGFGIRALLDRGAGFRGFAWLVAAVAIASAYAGNRSRWRESLARAERMSAEAKFFLRMNEKELLRHPLVPPASMNELRWFKEEHLGLNRGAGWFADDLYLCGPSRKIERIWQYRRATGSIEDVTSLLPGIRSGYCASFRDAPLRADFRYADGDFFWDLGPYATGQYAIVYADGIERFDVAPRGGYRHHAAVLSLRVRYEAPEGWVAFSPGISIDLRGNRRARWERGP
jgi:hypothetical protein